MAQEQSEWATTGLTRSFSSYPGLQHADTVLVKKHSIHRASTEVVTETIKSTEEVVEEMRTWLRTGVTPDRTRMMSDEAWQWHQDYYQATKKFDPDNENLPEDALVDYSYWTAPYLAHIGKMNFIMMHSQVNFADGTHMPTDRLRQRQKKSKRLQAIAQKRTEIMRRDENKSLMAAMDPAAHRGHPLRKDGLYTKYFWKPFLKQETRVPCPILLESASAEYHVPAENTVSSVSEGVEQVKAEDESGQNE